MKSSTQTILEHTSVPKHIAVIMDGNGRWAKKRFLPRVMGHKRGLDALENMVKHCAKLGVQYLTVFAFSTENWRRPEDEVSFLMGLFLQALQKQVRRLHENNMRLNVLGSRERFNRQILQGIEEAEALTGVRIENRQDAERAAKILQDCGVKNVVIKGGHLGDSRSEYCIDWLFTPDEVFEFTDRRFPTAHTHGTGCTFSACIAAELAKSFETLEAVQTAKKYITEAIRNPLNIGAGHGPVNHWAYRD